MNLMQESLGGNLTRIALDGRLDLEGTQKIGDQFSFRTTTAAGRFAVDLSQVTFIASIGIRMLLTAARAQAQRGGRMVLISPGGMSRKVLETAGVDALVPIVADLDAARSALGAA
jgi:anti-sigma B factor antagonist